MQDLVFDKRGKTVRSTTPPSYTRICIEKFFKSCGHPIFFLRIHILLFIEYIMLKRKVLRKFVYSWHHSGSVVLYLLPL